MTTINKEEIQKFTKMAEEWWDVNGKFKPLHMFNPIRIEYILDQITRPCPGRTLLRSRGYLLDLSAEPRIPRLILDKTADTALNLQKPRLSHG